MSRANYLEEYFEVFRETVDEWILRDGAGLTGADGEGPVGVVGLEPLLLRLIDEYGLVPLFTRS